MGLEINKSIYSVFAAFALVGLTVSCSSESGSGSDTDSTSSESSAPPESSNSKIDEKLLVTVECVVTNVEADDIVNVEEVGASEKLITLKAQSYFYFDQIVTVTNYTNEAEDVYIEHRMVDATGNVFDTSNFLEVVNAGETITLTDNKINQPAREIVVRADTSLKKTWFDCPVVEARL